MVLVEEIKSKLLMFNSSNLIHEARGYNKEAHFLAKAATSLAPGRNLWLTERPDIVCIPLSVEI